MIHIYDAANVLRERWDDAARTFTAWDENGTQTEQRPYTAQENAEADARVQAETEQANEATLREQAAADLTALSASIDQLNLVVDKNNNAIGGGDTKAVAREARAIARATKRLTRLMIRQLDGTE